MFWHCKLGHVGTKGHELWSAVSCFTSHTSQRDREIRDRKIVIIFATDDSYAEICYLFTPLVYMFEHFPDWMGMYWPRADDARASGDLGSTKQTSTVPGRLVPDLDPLCRAHGSQ